MEKLYYIINELIKSYHVFCKFDKNKAAEILTQINKYRLQIAILADQRQIFIEQLNIPANASGYKQDVFFTHDDIDSLVTRMIGNLVNGTKISLVQQGTRENLFTRQSMDWQQLMSQIQFGTVVGQQIPFDFPQEIYLEKSQTLDIGVTGQTSDGRIFVHGCNLKDDAAPNASILAAEIAGLDSDGNPLLPVTQIVPVLFTFPSAVAGTAATAINGGSDIYSIKSDRSVILTEVAVFAANGYKVTLIDKGRDQLICDQVDILGVAGNAHSQYAAYYPLPYPHLLRRQDRIQLKGINGSAITGGTQAADTPVTLAFRGFTI